MLKVKQNQVVQDLITEAATALLYQFIHSLIHPSIRESTVHSDPLRNLPRTLRGRTSNIE